MLVKIYLITEFNEQSHRAKDCTISEIDIFEINACQLNETSDRYRLCKNVNKIW